MILQEYIIKNKKTHLIFDFDETLFFLQLPWEKCLELIEEELIAMDNDLYSSYLSMRITWASLQNEYVGKYGQKAKELIIKNNTQFETENLLGVDINYDLVRFMKDVQNIEFNLWSSNTKDTIYPVLQQHHLYQKFTYIITRNDVDLLKPHAEGFEKIYNKDISKEKYLMIGDSSADMLAAKNAGIDFFKVQYFK